MKVPTPHAHRAADVLELDFTGIDERYADLAPYLHVNDIRSENTTGRRLSLQPSGNIDPFAEYVIALNDNFAEIDADAKLDGTLDG